MRQYRNVETYLSETALRAIHSNATSVAKLLKERFEDDVAPMLYSLNIVRDNEVIVDLHIGDHINGMRPIRCTCIEDKEVELIVHS